MRYILTILLGLCLGILQPIRAQQIESFDRISSDGYNFWLYTPGGLSPDTVRKPLIIFLHGQSLCGRNLNKVLRYGPLDALRRGRQIDAYVLAPQNPGGEWMPSKVIRLADWAIVHHAVDSCRVYVIGMSLGGFGTISVVSAYPDRFAAAMALCGGGTRPDYKALSRVPLWIMHGTADRAVGIRESDALVKGIREACAPGDSSRLLYDRFKGYDHGILGKVFYMPQTYRWLFAHTLNDPGRPLCKDVAITKAEFNNAYLNLHASSWAQIKRVEHTTTPSATGGTQGATPSPTADLQADSDYHEIKSGDTLYGIARLHHTSVKKLCQLNGIKESAILRPGRKLRVR